MTLKEYIEELRKERDRYFDISERSQYYNDDIAETRVWLLNRIIGELERVSEAE